MIPLTEIAMVPAGVVAVDGSPDVAIAAGLVTILVLYILAYINLVSAIDVQDRPLDLKTSVVILFPLLVTFVTYVAIKTFEVVS